jgi:hypothetical protein
LQELSNRVMYYTLTFHPLLFPVVITTIPAFLSPARTELVELQNIFLRVKLFQSNPLFIF